MSTVRNRSGETIDNTAGIVSKKPAYFYDTALWVFWLSRVIDRKFHDRKQAQNFHK
jgi:hypothetical protein